MHAIGPVCYPIHGCAVFESFIEYKGNTGLTYIKETSDWNKHKIYNQTIDSWKNEFVDEIFTIGKKGICVLSLKQPFAIMIVFGIKGIENRIRPIVPIHENVKYYRCPERPLKVMCCLCQFDGYCKDGKHAMLNQLKQCDMKKLNDLYAQSNKQKISAMSDDEVLKEIDKLITPERIAELCFNFE